MASSRLEIRRPGTTYPYNNTIEGRHGKHPRKNGEVARTALWALGRRQSMPSTNHDSGYEEQVLDIGILLCMYVVCNGLVRLPAHRSFGFGYATYNLLPIIVVSYDQTQQSKNNRNPGPSQKNVPYNYTSALHLPVHNCHHLPVARNIQPCLPHSRAVVCVARPLKRC